MTREELDRIFEDNHDLYLKSKELAPSIMTQRRDLRAFTLIDNLLPGRSGDIVSDAQHDMIWLDVNLDELAEVITEEQIQELIMCGCMVDEDLEGLCMYA